MVMFFNTNTRTCTKRVLVVKAAIAIVVQVNALNGRHVKIKLNRKIMYPNKALGFKRHFQFVSCNE